MNAVSTEFGLQTAKNGERGFGALYCKKSTPTAVSGGLLRLAVSHSRLHHLDFILPKPLLKTSFLLGTPYIFGEAKPTDLKGKTAKQWPGIPPFRAK